MFLKLKPQILQHYFGKQNNAIIIIIQSIRWSGLKTIKLIKLPKNTAPSLMALLI